MKKIYLLFLLLSFGITNAQLPNGSVAPLFTLNDINGNTHSLANYLAQGKTVLIDFSTTWCPNCWDYHQSNILHNMYNTYGANGTNQVVILFAEIDGATGLNELNGIGNDTMGNYLENMPYPVIDSEYLGDLYQISEVATLVRICPDGLVYTTPPLTLQSTINTVNTCITLGTILNYASIDTEPIYSCDSNNTPVVNLKNYGTNTITSAVIELKENGNLIETKNFTGNIAQHANVNIGFTPINMNPTSTYTFNLLSVNGVTPYVNSVITDNFNLHLAPALNTTNIQIHVYTDDNPEEMGWWLQGTSLGDFSEIVASGGSYDIDGNTYTNDTDANTIKIHYVTVPTNDECYKIHFGDSASGWNSNTQYHGIKIYANGTLINDIPVGSFDLDSDRNAVFYYRQPLSVDEHQNAKISVFPNPTTGLVNINYPEVVTAKVYNLVGKLLIQQESVNSIDLSGLENGVYMINIMNENINKTLKIIKK